jgi:hypothetical protein
MREKEFENEFAGGIFLALVFIVCKALEFGWSFTIEEGEYFYNITNMVTIFVVLLVVFTMPTYWHGMRDKHRGVFKLSLLVFVAGFSFIMADYGIGFCKIESVKILVIALTCVSTAYVILVLLLNTLFYKPKKRRKK